MTIHAMYRQQPLTEAKVKRPTDIEIIPLNFDAKEVKPVMKPKAKGRPKGAPNKGPSKPRAKKAQIQEAPVEEAYEAYEPTSPRRNLKKYPLIQALVMLQQPC